MTSWPRSPENKRGRRSRGGQREQGAVKHVHLPYVRTISVIPVSAASRVNYKMQRAALPTPSNKLIFRCLHPITYVRAEPPRHYEPEGNEGHCRHSSVEHIPLLKRRFVQRVEVCYHSLPLRLAHLYFPWRHRRARHAFFQDLARPTL